MCGELRDLVAQPVQLDDVWMSRDDTRAIDVHRRFSSRRLYIPIFEASRSRDDARSHAEPDFFEWWLPARTVVACTRR
jgi:hypothetical protein